MQSNGWRLLKVAEYTSLAASVTGVVIATATRQVVYAAAPLSVSLFLNLLSRQRFEQRSQQHLRDTVVRVEAQFSQLNRDFSELRQAFTRELDEQLQALDTRVTSLQETQDNVPHAIAQFEERISRLTANITEEVQSLRQHLRSLDTELAEEREIQQSLSQLQNRLDALESLNLEAIPQRLAQFQTQFEAQSSQLQQSVSSLRQQLQSQPDPAAIDRLQRELSQLRNQLASLESLNLGSALDAIAQLQGQYDSLLASTGNFNQRLENAASTEQVEPLQVAIAQLQADLQNQQDTLEATTSQLQELQTFLEFQPTEDLTVEPAATPHDVEPDIDSFWSIADEDEEEELELLSLNLGIDFGTSFTKVCFRDIGRDRSEVVTFAEGQAHLEEALLPTKIGILADGSLLAGLTAAEWEVLEQPLQTSIEYIKMRLADLDISQESERWRLERFPELDRPDMVENLCAYYLSWVMARAQSWIRLNKPELVENQKVEWSANVGVPVAYCDSPAIARFEKVLFLAWLLVNEPQTERFTLESLSEHLNRLRSQIDETIDCHAIPEISAEVWSCLNSREFDDGFYTFFDVGCGTLDGVSFRYWRDRGEPKVDFYSGLVKPFGVSAITQSLAAELNLPPVRIKNTIFNGNGSPSIQLNPTQSRRQIQRLVGEVVIDGYQRHGTHRPIFKDAVCQSGLNVLIGGGGGWTDFYQRAILDTHADFRQNTAGIPSYIQRNIPIPKDLTMNGLTLQEFHRFSVAYGLSIPAGEAPEVRLPSVMANVKPQELEPPPSRERYEDTRGSW